MLLVLPGMMRGNDKIKHYAQAFSQDIIDNYKMYTPDDMYYAFKINFATKGYDIQTYKKFINLKEYRYYLLPALYGCTNEDIIRYLQMRYRFSFDMREKIFIESIMIRSGKKHYIDSFIKYFRMREKKNCDILFILSRDLLSSNKYIKGINRDKLYKEMLESYNRLKNEDYIAFFPRIFIDSGHPKIENVIIQYIDG